MWAIPASYEGFMRRRNLTWDMKVNVNGVDYGRDVVMDFSIDRRLVSSDEFVIGTANMGKLEIKLRLQHELPANAKVIPYLGLSVGNLSWQDAHIPWAEANFPWSGGNLGWIPMGEFYVDSRERLKNIWVYTCFDKLYLADGAFLSNLTYPATMQAVWDEICGRLGYTYDSSVVINPNYKIPAGPAGSTMRQTMGFIASANGASVFVGRDGTIKFKRFTASAAPDFEMDESDYHRLVLTNPEKSYSRIVIGYDGEEGVRFEAGTGSENETLYIDNPYATQAMANALLMQLNGFSYVPIDMSARGYPHLEPGDVIEFERKESMSWQDANLSWQDAHFPWDGVYRQQTTLLVQSFTYRGGLVMSLESPSSSEQQSEFPTPGPITQEINRLNRDAVKLGRKYYGVGFTRENGFQLNREDGLSEVIWNSDVMDWKVDGERVLYLDVLERKLKFNGHLEAATGTFSGNLNAAGGTFSGNLSAAGGTFTGTLQGVDGTFSGNLSAAGGTFRGNLSAAGGTFTGTLQGADGTFSGTLNAATINGGIITGATIQTAAAGERIVLSPDGFKYHDMAGRLRVTLGTNDEVDISGFTFRNASQQSMGLIYAISDELHLMGNRDLRVGTNSGGTVTLQGPVYFTNGSSITGLSIASIDGLQSELSYIRSLIANHTHTVTLPPHNHGNPANQPNTGGGTFTTSRP